jgi:glycosyltransferase involved in cell wall biosynthesis
MTKPALTICISTFNEEPFIERCITHLQNQTLSDFAAIIVDNASTDRTVEIAKGLAKSDTRFSVREPNFANEGPIQNFQRCYWLPDSEFVMQASANDYVEPRYLETLVGALRSDPDVAVSYSHLTSENRIPRYFEALESDPVDRATTVMREFYSGHVIYGIFRRRTLDWCAPLAYRMGTDHILIAEAALLGKVKCVPEELYHRKPHPGRTPKGNAKLCSDYDYRLIEPPDPFDGDIGAIPPYLEMILAHIEMFDRARITNAQKRQLKSNSVSILAQRFQSLILDEIKDLMQHCAAFVAHVAANGLSPGARLHGVALTKALTLAQMAVPDITPYLFKLNKSLYQLMHETI